MSFLAHLDAHLDRFATLVGRCAGWLLVPLVAITVFDVVSRRFFVLGSIMLQELEWHLHTFLFALALGYAYLRNAHVRIDIVRARLAPRARAWIELVGCVLFMVPWCVVLFYYGIDHAKIAWEQGEVSSSGMGLPYRWVVKAALPLGLSVLFAAGLSVILRTLIALFGPAELRRRATEKLEGTGTGA